MAGFTQWYWPVIGWYGLIPSALVIPIAYFYSRAISKGLASARDEQHRMTPLDPWEFFDREFSSRWKRIIVWRYLWLFIVAVATLYEIFLDLFISSDWADLSISSALAEMLCKIGAFFLALVGLMGFSCAWITILAPRAESSFAPTFIGGAIGTLAWCLIIRLIVNAGDEEVYMVFLSCFAVGLGIYFLTWRYVRRKLNRAWFRFDD